MSTRQFHYEIVPGGIQLQMLLEQKGLLWGKTNTSDVPLSDWCSDNQLNIVSALARIDAMAESPDDLTHELNDGSGYLVSDQTLSELTEAQASSLGLPSTIGFELRISMTGPLVKPDTSIQATWHKRSGQRLQISRTGALAFNGKDQFRIPFELFQVLECIDAVNAWDGSSLDERLTLISALKLELTRLTGVKINIEKQLDEMNLMHASSVSLDLTVTDSGINFDPVLFSRQTIETTDGQIIKEDDQLVSPDLQRAFRQQFRASQDVNGAYVLTRNQYLFVDPALRPALKVVREMQDKSPEERQRFAKSPQSFIKTAFIEAGIEDELADQIVESSFVETDKFSDRVLEIGVWTPPVLPFVKNNPNTWLPEGFGLKIGTTSYTVSEEAVRPLAERLAEALTKNETSVPIPGTEACVPVSSQALAAVNILLEQVLKTSPVLETEEKTTKPLEPKPRNQKSVLKVQENFISSEFIAKFSERAKFDSYEQPEGLLNQPKSHQIAGIEWLQKCWSRGFPGALLADDMGLGKTFQTLGFMSWLFEKRKSLGLSKTPVLIVAPTSLLGNWEREAQIHIAEKNVGTMELLYGRHLNNLRLPDCRSNDIVLGRKTLDTQLLLNTSWVLTTYETMRDHHISLAGIPFSCIVFDEMQKIKNPKSMMTNAAQALNGDFVLGLTGTPIENSLADLWTLFDTLMPGAMGWGDLRQFLNYYTTDYEDRLRNLKRYLQVGTEKRPPPMLRRMKAEVAKDLPRKTERVIDCQMPSDQARIYQEAVNLGQQAISGKDKQTAFQTIRGVSLHPFYPDSDEAADGNTYVSASARLSATIEILDKVHEANEKALVFIESRAMHEWLSFYLKQRYQLTEKPARIYGAVTSTERSKIVDRFQDPDRDGQFDLLLLSPKAAGVGLTLTAATHVIHLSRWWNPAVEDQCTDRAYRIGQTKDVHVYIPRAIHPLYGEGSFDHILHGLLERKRSLSSEMLIPMETGDEMDQIYAAMATPTH